MVVFAAHLVQSRVQDFPSSQLGMDAIEVASEHSSGLRVLV